MTSSLGLFVACGVVTIAVVTVIWVIGLFQGNHSMMDGYYGFGFAVPAWVAFWVGDARSQVAALLLLMVSLHGCRLGWYLAARWRRFVPVHGGDPRYLAWRRQYARGYWWKSFLLVVEPQALVIILVGCPAVWGILANRAGADRPGPLVVLGLLVFGVGYYFETVADGQLQAFLADRPHNAGRYLNTGVWTHTRHPNYFGNTLVWWGIWIVAVAGSADAWWTVIGPLANTLMLTKVLGSAYQDRYMRDRPEYQRLMARTRSFLPLPVRDVSRPAEADTEPAPAS